MISKSNHVKCARFVLLGVSEEAKNCFNFSVQCITKQLLDSVFVIFRIIEVSVRVISLSLRLQLITPTSTSIILDITKTSSNNCSKWSFFYHTQGEANSLVQRVSRRFKKSCVGRKCFKRDLLKGNINMALFVCLLIKKTSQL